MPPQIRCSRVPNPTSPVYQPGFDTETNTCRGLPVRQTPSSMARLICCFDKRIGWENALVVRTATAQP